MKVAILAGGKGTRLGTLSRYQPKPMVEIGGTPILLHIMEHYLAYGHGEFIVALGHRGDVIEKYFADFGIGETLSGAAGETIPGTLEAIELSLVRTGQNTCTGGRIKRLQPYLDGKTFMLTWGDGLANVNIDKLIDFHYSHGRLATVTAVHPPARFGHLDLNGSQVVGFSEKKQTESGWINGAFFVLEPQVFDYLKDDDTQWEQDSMGQLAKEGELMAYQHEGFWQCMDTEKEKDLLNSMWRNGNAPWLDRHETSTITT